LFLREFESWIRRHRSIAVMAGITLVLVPTLFTVFPDWGASSSVSIKLVVLLAWALAAALVVLSGVMQGEHIADLAEAEIHREQHGREVAERALIRAALLPEATSVPSHWDVQVFLPNVEATRLLPYFDPKHSGPEGGWAIDRDPGQGATGAAWTTNALVFVQGEAVSDSTYDLTEQQQEAFSHLTAVAATPIQDAKGRRLGVLTLATTAENPDYNPQVAIHHVGAAEIVARVLIDVGKRTPHDA